MSHKTCLTLQGFSPKIDRHVRLIVLIIVIIIIVIIIIVIIIIIMRLTKR